jgi:DNA repair exonuclease SbcCD ATPase subunit
MDRVEAGRIDGLLEGALGGNLERFEFREDAIKALIDALEEARAERDDLAVSEARYASLQKRDERLAALRAQLETARAALRGARRIVNQRMVDYDDNEVSDEAETCLAQIDAALAELEGTAKP